MRHDWSGTDVVMILGAISALVATVAMSIMRIVVALRARAQDIAPSVIAASLEEPIRPATPPHDAPGRTS